MDQSDYFKKGPDPRNVSLPLLPSAPAAVVHQRMEHMQVVNNMYQVRTLEPSKQNVVAMPPLNPQKRGSMQSLSNQS